MKILIFSFRYNHHFGEQSATIGNITIVFIKINPDKFPEVYIVELTGEEWNRMKSKFSTSLTAGGKVKLPKAFSETQRANNPLLKSNL